MTAALDAKDKVAVKALRIIQAALKDKKVAERIDALSDADVIRIIQRVAVENRDVHEKLKSHGLYGDREYLVKEEEEVLKIIEGFLPEKISPEELKTKLKEIIAQVGANSIFDMRKVVTVANDQLAGRADTGMINNTIKQLLAGM